MALSKIDTAAIAADAVDASALDLSDNYAFTGTLSGVGKVLQVKQARKTNAFSTSSTSFQNVTDLAITITPTSSTSKFLVSSSLAVSANWWSSGGGYFGISRNGTNIAGDGSNLWVFQYGADSGNSPHEMLQWSEQVLDSPATSSAITYRTQLASASASYTIYVNRRAASNNKHGNSWLTVMEIEG